MQSGYWLWVVSCWLIVAGKSVAIPSAVAEGVAEGRGGSLLPRKSVAIPLLRACATWRRARGVFIVKVADCRMTKNKNSRAGATGA